MVTSEGQVTEQQVSFNTNDVVKAGWEVSGTVAPRGLAT